MFSWLSRSVNAKNKHGRNFDFSILIVIINLLPFRLSDYHRLNNLTLWKRKRSMRYPQHVARDDRLLSYLHGDVRVFEDRNIENRRKWGNIFLRYKIFLVVFISWNADIWAMGHRWIAGLAEVQEYPSTTPALARVQQLPTFFVAVRSFESERYFVHAHLVTFHQLSNNVFYFVMKVLIGVISASDLYFYIR